MEWWQPIVLGAGIALLAGPLTELIKSYFTRKHEQDERRRMFQRDTLLSLQQALTRMSVAAHVAMFHAKQNDVWPEKYDSEWVQEFEQAMMKVHRNRVLIQDEDVRLVAFALTESGMRILASKSEAESDEETDKETDLYRAVNERIGEIVRGL